ncbi:hypothetical protein [Brevundimonas aveniformis]|uniref:hypothetical protein n=1 Tax=Brevundimonas aveniformis TaxID=370977 RepID=UPI0004914EEC|nr:hypothetical protein [Brevundimonas aveniformis]
MTQFDLLFALYGLLLGMATAALAPWRKVAVAALILVLAYTLWSVGESAVLVFGQGGWEATPAS